MALHKDTFKAVQDMLKLATYYQWIDELEGEGPKLPRSILPTITERRSVVNAVENAVSQLPDIQQSIVRQMYMSLESDYLLAYQVYTALQIHANTYTKYKQRAFMRLAAALLPANISECQKVVSEI